MRTTDVKILIAVAAAVTMAIGNHAAAKGSPSERCQAGKNQAAGKYALCRSKAEAKFLLQASPSQYAEAMLRCEYKFAITWEKLEAKTGTPCPDEPLDQGSLQSSIDGCVTNVATALATGTLPNCTADLAHCASQLGVCDTDKVACQGDLGTCQSDLLDCVADEGGCQADLGTCEAQLDTCGDDLAACQAMPSGQLRRTGQTTCYDSTFGTPIACPGTGQDGDAQAGLSRTLVDNGDGTVTDGRTGLLWEKLSDDGSIHDWQNTYTWATAFTVKVATLNASAFAGYSDWRVPNVSELQSLLNYGASFPAVDGSLWAGCSPGCTVFTCSCTVASYYYSSTSNNTNPGQVWIIDFDDGDINNGYRDASRYVRAVRGGA